jgi:hypothetical protein
MNTGYRVFRECILKPGKTIVCVTWIKYVPGISHRTLYPVFIGDAISFLTESPEVFPVFVRDVVKE